MKKLIVAIGVLSLALLSSQASADGRHYRGHGHHRGGSDNFIPFVIGAAITGAVVGSVINNNREYERERVVEHRYYPPPPPPPRVVKRYYYEEPPRYYEERRYSPEPYYPDRDNY